MDYGRVNKLSVFRKLATGVNVSVGVLAQNNKGIYFQYDTSYLAQYHNLSPFNLSFDSTLQLAPVRPHNRLHGAFSETSLDS